ICVTPQFGGGVDYGEVIALQADGKIVLCGNTSNHMAVARYTTSGQLDTSFNGNGTVVLPLNGAYSNLSRGVVVQNSGGIVLTGETNFASTGGFVYTTLVRLTPAGALDTPSAARAPVSTSTTTRQARMPTFPPKALTAILLRAAGGCPIPTTLPPTT